MIDPKGEAHSGGNTFAGGTGEWSISEEGICVESRYLGTYMLRPVIELREKLEIQKKLLSLFTCFFS